jgi:hypothetical protein
MPSDFLHEFSWGRLRVSVAAKRAGLIPSKATRPKRDRGRMRVELANLEANIARDEAEFAEVCAAFRRGEVACCPTCGWENIDGGRRARRAENRVERRRQILVKLFRDSGQYGPLPPSLDEPGWD